MPASTASPAPPTPTSTSTPARTSSARSSSRSTCPSSLRAELARPSWKGEHVALGTNTDPYQWVEGRYRLMPGIWEAMRDFANPCSVLTKSPLLLRDLELMQGDRRADRVRRQPLDPDPRREGLARDRAAHPAPAQADRGGGRAEPGRDPDRRPDRAADPGRQRLAGAGRARSSSSSAEAGADSIGGVGASPARRGARDLVRLAARAPPGSPAALRGALRSGAHTCRGAEADRLAAMVRRGRRRRANRRLRQRAQAPASDAGRQPTAGAAARLF